MAGESRLDHADLSALQRIPPLPDGLQVKAERIDKRLAPVFHVVQTPDEQFKLEGILPSFNPFKKGQPEIDLEHFGIVFR